MGVVLVDRVIGVDDGGAGVLADLAGQQERGKFALCVDHVGLPADQRLHLTAGQRRAQPRAGIDQPGAHGADIGHIALHMGVQIGREGQHPDLVALRLQLPLEIEH